MAHTKVVAAILLAVLISLSGCAAFDGGGSSQVDAPTVTPVPVPDDPAGHGTTPTPTPPPKSVFPFPEYDVTEFATKHSTALEEQGGYEYTHSVVTRDGNRSVRTSEVVQLNRSSQTAWSRTTMSNGESLYVENNTGYSFQFTGGGTPDLKERNVTFEDMTRDGETALSLLWHAIDFDISSTAFVRDRTSVGVYHANGSEAVDPQPLGYGSGSVVDFNATMKQSFDGIVRSIEYTIVIERPDGTVFSETVRFRWSKIGEPVPEPSWFSG